MNRTASFRIVLLTALLQLTLGQAVCKAAERQPPAAWTLYQAALEYQEKQDHKKALDHFNRALEAGLTYHRVYAYRGDALRELKRYSQAIDDYTRIIDLGVEKTCEE